MPVVITYAIGLLADLNETIINNGSVGLSTLKAAVARVRRAFGETRWKKKRGKKRFSAVWFRCEKRIIYSTTRTAEQVDTNQTRDPGPHRRKRKTESKVRYLRRDVFRSYTKKKNKKRKALVKKICSLKFKYIRVKKPLPTSKTWDVWNLYRDKRVTKSAKRATYVLFIAIKLLLLLLLYTVCLAVELDRRQRKNEKNKYNIKYNWMFNCVWFIVHD